MFEAVIDQLKQQVTEVIKSQHNLDQPTAERTAEAAGKALLETVKKEVAQKDFSTVTEALSGAHTEANHPAVQKLVSPIGQQIAERTGLDLASSTNIASTLLPVVFNMFNDQVQHAKASGVDVQALVRQLASGGLNMANMGSVMTLAKNFMKGKSGKSNGVTDMLSKFF